MRLRRWQAWTLRLAGTIALLTAVFWLIPVTEVAGALRHVKLGYVGAGFALELTAIYVQAIQLWMLLRRQGVPVGRWRVFEVSMVTRFYGQLLPSEVLAGAVKLHRLVGQTSRWGEVVASLAFLRVVNMLVLVLLGLLFWAVEMPSGPGRWIGPALGGLGLALVAAHVLLASPAAGRGARRLLPTGRVSWPRGRLVEGARELARSVVAGYRVSSRGVMSAAALAALRHLMGMVSYALFALALGVELSYPTIGWIRSTLQVLLMLPISVAGIGVREGSLVVLLPEYGVPASSAVALAFLLFAVNLVTSALGGLFEIRNVLRPGRVGVAARGAE